MFNTITNLDSYVYICVSQQLLQQQQKKKKKEKTQQGTNRTRFFKVKRDIHDSIPRVDHILIYKLKTTQTKTNIETRMNHVIYVYIMLNLTNFTIDNCAVFGGRTDITNTESSYFENAQ